MSEFKDFKTAMQAQFSMMAAAASKLYLTGVGRDELWEKYLSSFPDGSNPIYKERGEYDCNTCKQFIRPYGNVVAVINGKIVSIWDIDVPAPFKAVADAMSAFVKSKPIVDVFVTQFAKLGVDKNRQMLPDGSIITWEHFSFELPSKHVYRGRDSVEAVQGEARSAKDVFKRVLDEVSVDSIETVLDLIMQNSLYRGDEKRRDVEALLAVKREYDKIKRQTGDRDTYAWVKVTDLPSSVTHIRNTSIGTLLVDIEQGRDLDEAVSAYERIMAPSNYKRPNALFTKKMIENAQKTLEELGMVNSLGRRYAAMDDITVNNVIFANRDAKKAMNVFEELQAEAKPGKQSFAKVEEMDIEDFIKNVLPNATGVELFLENKHSGNFMSLIAPVDKDAPSMFKWGNNFSWSYSGDMADSIREKVKAAGGSVTGALRASLAWYCYDDLDLHVVEPDGTHIYYGNKQSGRTGGNLDVDMNAGGPQSKTPVENIVWPVQDNIKEGVYRIYVHNFAKRDSSKEGFEAEIEFNGQIYRFAYPKPVRNQETVELATIHYSKKEGVKFIKSMEHSETSRKIWGVSTKQFHPVSAIMFSPNYWDGRAVGNKHYFFMLDGCANEGTSRGFYNEFLHDDLQKHRKVFEALGSKMKVPHSDKQLSGVGFSSTQRNEVVCKVTGSFNRTIKIKF